MTRPATLPTGSGDLVIDVSESISTRVGREILNSEFDAGAWARALARVKDSRADVVAEYARIRIHQLMGHENRLRGKVEQLETRRLRSCLGIKSARDLLLRSNRGGRMNLPRPRLPLHWLALLGIGLAGSIASLLRLADERLPEPLLHAAPWLGLVLAGLLVPLLVLASLATPPRTLRLLWGRGLVALGALACLGSMALGAKVLEKHPHRGSVRTAIQSVPAAVSDETAVLQDEVVSRPTPPLGQRF